MRRCSEAKTRGRIVQGQMAPWVPQNASSGSREELGIAMSAPPRASSRTTAWKHGAGVGRQCDRGCDMNQRFPYCSRAQNSQPWDSNTRLYFYWMTSGIDQPSFLAPRADHHTRRNPLVAPRTSSLAAADCSISLAPLTTDISTCPPAPRISPRPLHRLTQASSSAGGQAGGSRNFGIASAGIPGFYGIFSAGHV